MSSGVEKLIRVQLWAAAGSKCLDENELRQIFWFWMKNLFVFKWLCGAAASTCCFLPCCLCSPEPDPLMWLNHVGAAAPARHRHHGNNTKLRAYIKATRDPGEQGKPIRNGGADARFIWTRINVVHASKRQEQDNQTHSELQVDDWPADMMESPRSPQEEPLQDFTS